MYSIAWFGFFEKCLKENDIRDLGANLRQESKNNVGGSTLMIDAGVEFLVRG